MLGEVDVNCPSSLHQVSNGHDCDAYHTTPTLSVVQGEHFHSSLMHTLAVSLLV